MEKLTEKKFDWDFSDKEPAPLSESQLKERERRIADLNSKELRSNLKAGIIGIIFIGLIGFVIISGKRKTGGEQLFHKMDELYKNDSLKFEKLFKEMFGYSYFETDSVKEHRFDSVLRSKLGDELYLDYIKINKK